MGVNIEHRNASASDEWLLKSAVAPGYSLHLTLSPTLYICFVLPSRDMREASSY